MKTCMPIVVVMFCWAVVLPGVLLMVEAHGGQGEGTMIILDKDELKDVRLRETSNRNWLLKYEPDGLTPVFGHGVYQQLELDGRHASIHYAEFGSEEAARNATVFRREDAAGIFRMGLWENAKTEVIGDEVWHLDSGPSITLLVRKGSIVMAITAAIRVQHDGEERPQTVITDPDAIASRIESRNITRSLVEKVAVHLVKKAEQGARVPVLEE